MTAEMISSERVFLSGSTFPDLETSSDWQAEHSGEDPLEITHDFESMEIFMEGFELQESFEVVRNSTLTERAYSIILSDCGEEACSFAFAGSELSDQAIGKLTDNNLSIEI